MSPFSLVRPPFAALRALLGFLALTGCGGTAADPATAWPSAEAQASAPATACDAARGRTLEVGFGKTYRVPSAAAAVAQSGDVIRIAAGDYRGDVAYWSASNLTICGIGGRARLFADAKSAGGKAIWVIGGSNITIDNIEFHDARVADRNGAGIRAEHSGRLAIRNAGFFDSENGILGGSAGATISIETSEFARNGYGDGFSHNLYIGNADQLTVSASFFHEAKVGHNFKSRARETRIETSYFMDGPSGTSSYLADFPNGGVVFLRGNLFQKGPNAENPTAIAYGAEGLSWPINTFEMVHNTVVITREDGSFLRAPAGAQSVKLTANLFAGTANPKLMGGGFGISEIAQQGNVTTAAANMPGAENIATPDFWPDRAPQALIGLARPSDPAYSSDAPRPFHLRAMTGPNRYAGALQRAP